MASRGITRRYGRGGALGAQVLKFDKPRSITQVQVLVREIAANDPDIEYAEADRVMRPDSTLP